MLPSPLTPFIRGKRYSSLASLFVFTLIMILSMAANGVAAPSQDGAPAHAITLSAERSVTSVADAPLVTATVMVNGVAAPGQKVVFTWRDKDSSQPPQPGKTSATSADGTTTYRLHNFDGRPKTITVTASLENDPSILATADVRFELPDGFIALANRLMALPAAQAYCREMGGKLPRLNDTDSLPRTDEDKVTRIDGFGAPGAPWPSGLPLDRYWTGTAFTGEPADPGYHSGVWLIGVQSERVIVHNEGKSATYRTICVP